MLRFLIAAFLSMLLSSCSNEIKQLPEGNTEVRVKALSTDITEVAEVGDSLMITHYKNPIANGHNWVLSFFTDAHTVLSRLHEASNGKEYRQVVFMVKIPAQDKLGREFEQQGMKVFYDMQSLKGANWVNMTPFDLMELPSDIELKSLGIDFAVEYCRDGEIAKYSKNFCLKAFARNLAR